MAKDLAREVGYIYIDSGAMYRAVTLYSIENGIFDGDVIDTERLKKEIKDIHISFRLNKETGRPDTYLNGGKTVVPMSRPSMTIPFSFPIACC